MVKLELTEREFDVILTGLRNLELDLDYQDDSDDPLGDVFSELKPICYAHDPVILRAREVAELAERINVMEVPPPPPPRHNQHDRSLV